MLPYILPTTLLACRKETFLCKINMCDNYCICYVCSVRLLRLVTPLCVCIVCSCLHFLIKSALLLACIFYHYFVVNKRWVYKDFHNVTCGRLSWPALWSTFWSHDNIWISDSLFNWCAGRATATANVSFRRFSEFVLVESSSSALIRNRLRRRKTTCGSPAARPEASVVSAGAAPACVGQSVVRPCWNNQEST